MNHFTHCRQVPKEANERMIGEGDRVLRDKVNRYITLWYVGTDTETWNRYKETGKYYESVAYYNEKEGIVR